MGCHALLRGIFLTQGSYLGLLHCPLILLPSGPPRKPTALCLLIVLASDLILVEQNSLCFLFARVCVVARERVFTFSFFFFSFLLFLSDRLLTEGHLTSLLFVSSVFAFLFFLNSQAWMLTLIAKVLTKWAMGGGTISSNHQR